ncbi:MAG: aminotransferase class V-fold PLP-dependent enzyme [Deltaproteobacteria bacterium]
MKRIYLDNNATTAVDPLVLEAMLPYYKEFFGNPSSGHRFGEEAHQAIDLARQQVAALVGSRPEETYFTGGGTEANNMAIHSALLAAPDRQHIITSNVEHPSVLAPLAAAAARGYVVQHLAVDENGNLDLEELEEAIKPDTALVSLMAANNETGVIWDLHRIAALCREKGVPFHCDAVQMAGKLPIDMGAIQADYLTLAAHKLHGPKGCGALCVRRATPIHPLIRGAGQERGKRAGTENVGGLAGFGSAAELAADRLEDYQTATSSLRDGLEVALLQAIPNTRVNGSAAHRLPNTSNISFQNTASAAIIQELDEQGIAVSAHSACHSGDLDPSHVLLAMHIPEDFIHGTLRISLSRFTKKAEVDELIAILPDIVARSRAIGVP